MPTLPAQGAAPSVTINNTAYLFFVLFGAFIVFITIRGDLPKWLGLLGLGGSPKAATSTQGGTAGATGGALPSLPSIPSIGATTNGAANGANGSGGPNLLGAATSDASNPLTYG